MVVRGLGRPVLRKELDMVDGQEREIGRSLSVSVTLVVTDINVDASLLEQK